MVLFCNQREILTDSGHNTESVFVNNHNAEERKKVEIYCKVLNPQKTNTAVIYRMSLHAFNFNGPVINFPNRDAAPSGAERTR